MGVRLLEPDSYRPKNKPFMKGNRISVLCLSLMCYLNPIHSQSADEENHSEPGLIIIDCNDEKQTIDGFGVAQADWADDVFLFKNREQVIDAMFGTAGLRLNILRGEIFPHYSTQAYQYNFDMQADTSQTAVTQASTLDKNDLLRRGQLWLTSHIRQKYPETLFMFSAWSPPAWMKEGGHATKDYVASHGRLKPNHYQDFANYMSAFYKAFQSIGVNIYALSPSNEPGYPAPWNSCVWTADEMGDFIHHYLLPTFEKEQIPAKVIFGENPAWSTVFDRLEMISSADFTNKILSKHTNLNADKLIAAGHGYVLPDTLPLPEELRRTPIIPFAEAEKKHIPVWVTEISDITPLDTSMEDGLRWATSFHQYLNDAQVDAIIWWAGAMPTTTNESLVVLNKATGDYILTKRYDTFGNYTRYIPTGSRRIENKVQNLPEGISVTSFKKDKQYMVVVVNPTDKKIECRLQSGVKDEQDTLHCYTTTAGKRWEESGITASGQDGYSIQVLPKSVTTYVGNIK